MQLILTKKAQYSAEGTAEMVIRVLMETLGLSKTRLAQLLKPFVYGREESISKSLGKVSNFENTGQE